MSQPTTPSSFASRERGLTLALSFVLLTLLMILGVLVIQHGRKMMEQHLRDRLRDIAAASAEQFDGKLIEKIRSPRDVHSPESVSAIDRLHAILADVPAINSAYILRKTDDPKTLSFVADASMMDSIEQLDANHNGVIEPDEEAPAIGQKYDATDIPAMRIDAFDHPSSDENITTDQWGSSISGYAPIRRWSDNHVVAILGVDMDATQYITETHDVFLEIALMVVLISAVTGVYMVSLSFRIRAMQTTEEARQGMLLLATHQLGEPLSIIKNSAEMLVDEIESPELKQVVSEHLGMLEEGIKRMDTVFMHLKEASAVEKNQLKVTLSRIDIRDIIQDVSASLEELREKREQRLVVTVEPSLCAFSDRFLLRKALTELVENALSFSAKGSEVIVVAYRKDGRAVIEVRDHGCGIPHEDLHRIFVKFGRAANAATMKPGGYGLGLFVVKGILQHIGGSVRATSEEGSGSTFIVDLPVQREEGESIWKRFAERARALWSSLVH